MTPRAALLLSLAAGLARAVSPAPEEPPPSVEPPRAEDAMRILDDREVMRVLPRKHLFGNIDDKIMRNAAGTRLHLGPGEKGEFFVVRGPGDWKKLRAPSTGKAYLGTNGVFQVWYDALTNGVHFAGGQVLRIDDPLATRFGVDYDATLCYLAGPAGSDIRSTADPLRALYRIEAAYVYKIARHGADVVSVGYRRFQGDLRREHRWWRHRLVEDEWMLIEEGLLPDDLVVVDADPAAGNLLLLKESVVVTGVHEYNLKTRALRQIGEADWFALYMGREFNPARPDAPGD